MKFSLASAVLFSIVLATGPVTVNAFLYRLYNNGRCDHNSTIDATFPRFNEQPSVCSHCGTLKLLISEFHFINQVSR
jgi:hypothetical protein